MDKIFGIHAAAVTLRGERAKVLAQNMANADTPGFKARDMAFQSMLLSQNTDYIRQYSTRQSHLGANASSIQNGQLQYRTPLQPSMDGNTVDLQLERAAFMENALHYQVSLRFLNGRISGLMTAIRGE